NRVSRAPGARHAACSDGSDPHMHSTRAIQLAAAAAVLCAATGGLSACSQAAPAGDGHGSEAEATEPTASTAEALNGATVESAVGMSCSTTIVQGLNQQIIDEVNCLIPGALSPVVGASNFQKGSG